MNNSSSQPVPHSSQPAPNSSQPEDANTPTDTNTNTPRLLNDNQNILLIGSLSVFLLIFLYIVSLNDGIVKVIKRKR